MADPMLRSPNMGASYRKIIYDNSAIKIVIIAIVFLVVSITFLSIYSYSVVKNAIISKLKSRDLIYTAQSISSKIDARITRAKETSLILAGDPFIQKWMKEGETDQSLGRDVKQKITEIARDYDYHKTFLVSAITGHYWSENGLLLDTLSKDDIDDSWFFNTIVSQERISLDIDYNNQYQDMFVFVNALIGDIKNPIGITGIGLNLNSISKEFQSYKFGEKSNMWLVDEKGKIYISEDLGQLGDKLTKFLPPDIQNKILSWPKNRKHTQHVIVEYKNDEGEIYDLIAQPISSTDWKLVFQIPRSESIQVVRSIKVNMIMAGIIIVILITFIFYLISSKIANPYKRAVQLSQELEKVVNERTYELNEKTIELQDKNTKIIDSIEYAKLIQESILPTAQELEGILRDYFIIWQPRDIVGGDFYWVKKIKDSWVMVVGDCTGHGVPGALMTMVANSILNYMIDETNFQNPGRILKEFDRIFRTTINKKDTTKTVDDGLDLGIVCVNPDRQLIFAGAKISLYVKRNGELKVMAGDCKGIGYSNINDDFHFSNHLIQIHPDDSFYMTTDGFIHQNGGKKDFSFGKKRFAEMIKNIGPEDFKTQQQQFEETLQCYMNGELQRDDITVIGFRL